jgi:hypothetical protein
MTRPVSPQRRPVPPSRMAHPVPPPRMIDCPVCLDRIPADGELYELSNGRPQPKVLPVSASAAKTADITRNSYRLCPNPSGDVAKHYLPTALTALSNMHPPIVVGFVGASQSGKTHLLTTMIAAIHRGELQRYGLSAVPMDLDQHLRFMSRTTNALIDRHERLPGTKHGVNDIADVFMITSPVTGTWPLTFFDIAGEDLTQVGSTGRFLAGAKALVFVVDPGLAMGWSGTEAATHGRNSLGDDTFGAVLARIDHGQPLLDVPAVIVVNKSDRLRFRPPVDAWLRSPSGNRVDPERIRAESRDAFALLFEHQAQSWLQPYYRCRRATLHFATATGGEVGDDERYPRGVRPGRVLEPLIALLAMTGVLAGPGCDEVGL